MKEMTHSPQHVTVMRSEGVLRLILNINLFKGMKIDLEQEKFLRIVALEDEKLVHFAIKVSEFDDAGRYPY
jgi:Ran-binding protein 3